MYMSVLVDLVPEAMPTLSDLVPILVPSIRE